MKIYMDVCCLNRPFDDLSQDRIYLESEAVLAIISRCEKDSWVLVASGAIDFELSKMQDLDRLEQVRKLYSVAQIRIGLSADIEYRAAILQQHGVRPFDSLHVASAESCSADVLLTTDDRLIKVTNRIDLNVRVANPLHLLIGGA